MLFIIIFIVFSIDGGIVVVLGIVWIIFELGRCKLFNSIKVVLLLLVLIFCSLGIGIFWLIFVVIVGWLLNVLVICGICVSNLLLLGILIFVILFLDNLIMLVFIGVVLWIKVFVVVFWILIIFRLVFGLDCWIWVFCVNVNCVNVVVIIVESKVWWNIGVFFSFENEVIFNFLWGCESGRFKI